jgi:hypothetical protein
MPTAAASLLDLGLDGGDGGLLRVAQRRRRGGLRSGSRARTTTTAVRLRVIRTG